MKYPEAQFKTLVSTLTILKEHFDFSTVHPCAVHFLVYQQHAGGQEHNSLVFNSKGQLMRRGFLLPNEAGKALIEPQNSFELYPDGCNDNHIETATKRALKIS